MCNTVIDNRFISIENPQRIWAMPSIHGDVDRLTALHDAVLERFEPGDRIVYLGNYTGYGSASVETIDEILAFRRVILSHLGVIPDDIVYLRGRQEDMWQRLMQLPFCPNPVDTMLWMLASGLSNTFQSYGICAHEGVIAAREGTMSLTRWTHKVRAAVRKHAGHDIFNTQFKRAAFTQDEHRFPLLFVNAGIDPHKGLAEQDDALWWSGETFTDMKDPYDPFEKVVRGFDPNHRGVTLNGVTASLDGGCGFGGSLVCAGIERSGDFFEFLEA
ncbi:MAG: hypothetical protein AAF569_03490 [Pseudomonadota bacterium]